MNGLNYINKNLTLEMIGRRFMHVIDSILDGEDIVMRPSNV